MWCFFVGAVIGICHLIGVRPRQFLQTKYPIQGVLVAAALGTGIYGTIIWLLAKPLLVLILML